MKPCYSEMRSSRRAVEELLVDNFQDLLINLEDESDTGYTEALAWDGTDNIGNFEDDTAEREVLQSADRVTHAGVLG